MRVAVIDHYDSFTYNLIEWLKGGAIPITVEHVFFDDVAAMARIAEDSCPLVFSPGPKSPDDVPQSMALMQKALFSRGILGVCLGHQMLGVLAGGRMVPAATPLHGLTRDLNITCRDGVLRNWPRDAIMRVAAYNSLAVNLVDNLGSEWRVSARSPDGDAQIIEHFRSGASPAVGLQFHPESFLTECGDALRESLLELFLKPHAGLANEFDP